jgi:hypothetical protein
MFPPLLEFGMFCIMLFTHHFYTRNKMIIIVSIFVRASASRKGPRKTRKDNQRFKDIKQLCVFGYF